MRDYAKVSPKFWIGPTGKAIRKQGADAQVLALYLMTSPHANMLGIYHLPVAYIVADTGLTFEGASEGLHRLCEAGFCDYDEASEVVFVYEMARYQIGEQLKPKDNQVEGVRREYRNLPESRLLPSFFEKYADAFHLDDGRGLQAPSKPLGSQEQEKEQEQEIEQEHEQALCGGPASCPPPAQKRKVDFDFSAGRFVDLPDSLVDGWADAYPAVNIQQEIAKAAAWLMSNPKNKKSDYPRFLNNWLSRTQDSARPVATQRQQQGKFDPVAHVNRNRTSTNQQRSGHADTSASGTIIDITPQSVA
ncbi:MAG: hypothetical protein VB138_02080 [Burkholderia sp.]